MVTLYSDLNILEQTKQRKCSSLSCSAAEDSSDLQGCQMAKFDPFLSLDCARVEGVGAQSGERKGSNFAAQRSGAIVKKPEGPNAYNLKILLSPSGNLV